MSRSLVRTIHSIYSREIEIKTNHWLHLRNLGSMASSDLTVKHDNGEKQGEFYIQLDGGGPENKAVLQYEWVRPGVMDMYHTGVPPAFRGRGVAKILAQSAMDFVVQKDLSYIPTCSYIDKFVRDNPASDFSKRKVDN